MTRFTEKQFWDSSFFILLSLTHSAGVRKLCHASTKRLHQLRHGFLVARSRQVGKRARSFGAVESSRLSVACPVPLVVGAPVKLPIQMQSTSAFTMPTSKRTYLSAGFPSIHLKLACAVIWVFDLGVGRFWRNLPLLGHLFIRHVEHWHRISLLALGTAPHSM